MKNIKKLFAAIIIFIVSMCFVLSSCNKPILKWKERTDENLLIMSYNIRYDSWRDVFKKDWDSRKKGLSLQIAEYFPDVIGMQEVEKNQYVYIEKRLSDQYDSICTYRGGGEEGEASPIFFNKSKFELLESNTFWLSETPEKLSMGWDATHYRICTYAILKNKKTDETFAFFNTHFENGEAKAKLESMKLVSSKIIELGYPTIFSGDFNSEEDSDTYSKAMEVFDNAKYSAINTMQAITYNAYGKEEDQKIFDHCFVTKENFSIKEYKVILEKNGNAFYSDHYPLLITIEN